MAEDDPREDGQVWPGRLGLWQRQKEVQEAMGDSEKAWILDVTAMLAIVSDCVNATQPELEHKLANGERFHPSLVGQLEEEMTNPIAGTFGKVLEGTLSTCESAFECFERIVSTLGSPDERLRASFLQHRVKREPCETTAAGMQSPFDVMVSLGKRKLGYVVLTSNKKLAKTLQNEKVPVMLHGPRSLLGVPRNA
mmetsp:Transcript_7846/g.14425  ORF Transcript_7846/g.14425 Transcript_7846/m.14425 type:complete len:195 (+) Transcript_7846:183-767(+)